MEKTAFLQQPADNFPDYLSLDQPDRRKFSSDYRLLLVLMLLCLIPRLWIAFRTPSIAGDGVHYVNAACALKAGDIQNALWEGGINVYILILAFLHTLGFDWETGAIVWGVAASTLLILPLWGWVRRQFDEQVALVACLLYIIHPKFILESPELMRDPTFWLLFSSAIYFLWRAVTEVRYVFFVVGGMAITLATLTRVEGVLLFVPLMLWTFWRSLALKTMRRKLILGLILCLIAIPALFLLIDLLFFFDQSDWAAIRLAPFERANAWIQSFFSHNTPFPEEGAPPSVGRILWRFFPTMTRGLSPVFALLMFGGIWRWRRVWIRRDNQALFLTAVLLLVGIWIQAWSSRYLKGNINARYALPIVLMASPFAALGLMAFMRYVVRLFEYCHLGRYSRPLALFLVAVLAIVPSVADVLYHNISNYQYRCTISQVGKWLNCGSPRPVRLTAPWDMILPVSYYAQNKKSFRYRYDDSDATIIEKALGSNVVLLYINDELTTERCNKLAENLEQEGFVTIPPEAIPNNDPSCRLLARKRWLTISGKSELLQ